VFIFIYLHVSCWTEIDYNRYLCGILIQIYMFKGKTYIETRHEV